MALCEDSSVGGVAKSILGGADFNRLSNRLSLSCLVFEAFNKDFSKWGRQCPPAQPHSRKPTLKLGSLLTTYREQKGALPPPHTTSYKFQQRKVILFSHTSAKIKLHRQSDVTNSYKVTLFLCLKRYLKHSWTQAFPERHRILLIEFKFSFS